ncbi:MAG: helix-turn-helix domain-containing protein, partial [Kordiimonas sp.]
MARRLLSQNSNNATVKMIAYKLGFSNPSNFARTYKQCYGFSPSDTRDLYRGNPAKRPIETLNDLNVGDRKWEYWIANMVL